MASFGIRTVLFGGVALMLWLSRREGASWVVVPIFLTPAVFAAMAYALVLEHVDKIALDHRENFISQLSR